LLPFLNCVFQCIPYISIQRLVNIGYPKIHCLIIMFIHVNICFLHSNHIMGCSSFSDRPKMAQISLLVNVGYVFYSIHVNIFRVYSEYIHHVCFNTSTIINPWQPWQPSPGGSFSSGPLLLSGLTQFASTEAPQKWWGFLVFFGSKN
jgi:hypothetical protein